MKTCTYCDKNNSNSRYYCEYCSAPLPEGLINISQNVDGELPKIILTRVYDDLRIEVSLGRLSIYQIFHLDDYWGIAALTVTYSIREQVYEMVHAIYPKLTPELFDIMVKNFDDGYKSSYYVNGGRSSFHIP